MHDKLFWGMGRFPKGVRSFALVKIKGRHKLLLLLSSTWEKFGRTGEFSKLRT